MTLISLLDREMYCEAEAARLLGLSQGLWTTGLRLAASGRSYMPII